MITKDITNNLLEQFRTHFQDNDEIEFYYNITTVSDAYYFVKDQFVLTLRIKERVDYKTGKSFKFITSSWGMLRNEFNDDRSQPWSCIVNNHLSSYTACESVLESNQEIIDLVDRYLEGLPRLKTMVTDVCTEIAQNAFNIGTPKFLFRPDGEVETSDTMIQRYAEILEKLNLGRVIRIDPKKIATHYFGQRQLPDDRSDTSVIAAINLELTELGLNDTTPLFIVMNDDERFSVHLKSETGLSLFHDQKDILLINNAVLIRDYFKRLLDNLTPLNRVHQRKALFDLRRQLDVPITARVREDNLRVGPFEIYTRYNPLMRLIEYQVKWVGRTLDFDPVVLTTDNVDLINAFFNKFNQLVALRNYELIDDEITIGINELQMPVFMKDDAFWFYRKVYNQLEATRATSIISVDGHFEIMLTMKEYDQQICRQSGYTELEDELPF